MKFFNWLMVGLFYNLASKKMFADYDNVPSPKRYAPIL